MSIFKNKIQKFFGKKNLLDDHSNVMVGQGTPQNEETSEQNSEPIEPSDNSPKMVAIGVFPMAQAESFLGEMKRKGIEVLLNHNAESCAGSCGTKVEVWGIEQHIAEYREYFQKAHQNLFSTVDHDSSLISEVFDEEKETARCPACAVEFSTQLKACPECELSFF